MKLFGGLMVRVACISNRIQGSYGNLKVHHLLGECRHLVVEAELVLANALRCEDEVALALLGTVQDDLAAGRGHGEVDIEGAAGLDLDRAGISD
jgi:hypothetical protein